MQPADLLSLPSDWCLVRVGRDKAPIAGTGWFDADNYSPDDAAALNGAGPPAWGLKSGPSSGVVVLDLDEHGWDTAFQRVTGHTVDELPPTITWTSGKPGRSGRAFQVDPEWWPHLANRRAFTRPWQDGDPLSKSGAKSAITTFELRWDRCQSVVLGAHPETDGYRWLPGCSPEDIPDPAPAPDWLLEPLLVQEHPDAPAVTPTAEDADRALAMLQCLPPEDYSAYSDWLRIGMALHHTDDGLLSAWVDWCRGMAAFDEAECLRKWESFGKASQRGRPATIATLHHLAKQHGYKAPKRKRSGGGGSGGVAPRPSTSTTDAWPFALLGFNGNDMFYQPGESGQVMSIPRNSHTAGSLMGLARIEFWEERFGRYNKDGICTGVHWQHAASELIGLQYRVGVYDPNRIRGVGAWWDESNVVYHLGDRLVISGKTWPVLSPPPSNYLYQRLPRRDGPRDAVPLTDAEGFELLSLAERFHWEAPASGMLLAGWVALAPICGVLRWRPHIWLNAVAGSGKSSVMHYFVRYLLGDLPLRVIGATTEAGIRQTLKSDALPIMFDEAESNEKPDAARIQSILTLARISSTDDQGVTLKGSPSAEATMFNIRSMFFMSSINTALKQGADRSRFSVLVLRVPDNLTDEQRRTHWESLEADLVRAITPETGQRMIARMVSLAGMVREAATVMAKAAAIELGSARQGDQIGALLTGAWALQNRHAPSLEEAQAFIRASGVREQAEGQADERGGDQGDCLQTILQARVRVETGKASLTRTVAELIEVAHQGALGLLDPTTELTAANARSELARHGILVHSTDGSSTPDGITVSNTAEGIKRLLRDTPWSNGGWANLLRSLPGATRTASPVWFPELKAMARGTRLPQRLLEDRSASAA